jgi:hypothetical protein
MLYKIISIIKDNVKNNDICAYYLHKMMTYIYDEYLDLMPFYA